MVWYEIAFYCSLGLLLVQALISFLFADFDVDVDTDFDISDIFSFKGIIHFIIGFTCVLTVTKNITALTYGIALVVGILFVLGLKWVYFYIYKNLKQEIKYVEYLDNVDAEVYYWDYLNQKGEVFVTLEGRKTLINIDNKIGFVNLKAGENIKVSGTRVVVYLNKN